MQLRRLVIGEAGRFPELGRLLYDSGPTPEPGHFSLPTGQTDCFPGQEVNPRCPDR